MELGETLKTLEKSGTEQNRKIYRRHGAKEPMFGVSFAELGKLQKTIKVDHALARQLWQTGIHDAKVLALQIADPARMDLAGAELWLRGVDNYVLCDYLAKLCAASPAAREISDAWRGRHEEWDSACGWCVLAQLATRGEVELDESWCEARIAEIAAGIHAAPNRTRYEMNGALIALSAVSPRVKKTALSAAKAIGKVVVDHGETGCKTPDAVPYIAKMAAHAKKRAGGAGGAGGRKGGARGAKTARPKAAAKARRPAPRAKKSGGAKTKAKKR